MTSFASSVHHLAEHIRTVSSKTYLNSNMTKTFHATKYSYENKKKRQKTSNRRYCVVKC